MTEFVLDNGGMKELISPARYLSIVQLYNIDVYIFFVVFAVFAIYIFAKFVQLFCSVTIKTSTNVKKHKAQ